MPKVILSVELIIIVLGLPVFVIVGCPVSIHFSSCPVKNSSHCRHYLNYELVLALIDERPYEQ